ncbi:MAG: M24 family metallopeptidase, partial [Gammaproteobacteria bacterium]|nr:M24 family metallopeptidase [Gammaproteobacteria bacterium]
MFKYLLLAFVVCLETILLARVISEPPTVLPFRDRAPVVNTILQDRLDNLLPELMQDSSLDMWIVIYREYSEDALFYSLVPQPTFAARRTTILVFNKDPETNKVERFSVSRYPIGEFYPTRWEGGSLEQQWQRLAELVAEIEPKRIGINISKDWALADGLTAGMHRQLTKYLDDKFVERLVPAENLVIRWLETRTEQEIKNYTHIVAIARGVISEAFSNRVITPGVTTTDDVAWYIRQRFEDLNVRPWFQPYVNVQRRGDNYAADAKFMGKSPRVIQRGDVLHTDVGICYLTLCTDTQEMGYVLRFAEKEVPKGLKDALADGNAWQDTMTQQFKTGRTGNEILDRAKTAAKKAKLNASI